MDRHERYIILTKTYGSHNESKPLLRSDNRRFVILRSNDGASRLRARLPQKVSRRGRPNARFDLHPKTSLITAKRSVIQSSTINERNPDPKLAGYSDFLKQIQLLKTEQNDNELLLITADFSDIPPRYLSDSALIQALLLQFKHLISYFGPTYPTYHDKENIFLACLPNRFVSDVYLHALSQIPVSYNGKIIEIPLRVSATLLFNGRTLKKYELQPLCEPISLTLPSKNPELSVQHLPSVDIRTGKVVFNESRPYLNISGHISGRAQITAILLLGKNFFEKFPESARLSLEQAITLSATVSTPVSFRLLPEMFLPEYRRNSLNMIASAAEYCRTFDIPTNSLYIEISSHYTFLARDIFERGFRTVLYDYPPAETAFSPRSLSRSGVAAVKLNAEKLAPDHDAEYMLNELKTFGIIAVVENEFDPERRKCWDATGAHIFQCRFPTDETDPISLKGIT